MAEAVKEGFIFMAPGANSSKGRAVVSTPSVIQILVGVSDYKDAAQVAAELADDGAVAIILCPGFGTKGVAIVKDAVGDKAIVAVARFDNCPGLDNKSGDELFE